MSRKRRFKHNPKPGRTPKRTSSPDATVFTHVVAGLLGYGLARLGMPPEDAFALSHRMMARANSDQLKAEMNAAQDEAETDFLLGLS